MMLENNAARKSLRDFRAARAAPGKGYAPQHQRGQSSWAWDGEINWLDHFSAEDDSDTDSDSWPWLRDDINWLGHEATWAWDEMNWQWHGAAWSWHRQDWHGHYWQGASSGYEPQNQPHPLSTFRASDERVDYNSALVAKWKSMAHRTMRKIFPELEPEYTWIATATYDDRDGSHRETTVYGLPGFSDAAPFPAPPPRRPPKAPPPLRAPPTKAPPPGYQIPAPPPRRARTPPTKAPPPQAPPPVRYLLLHPGASIDI